jgi:hypothetical protein
LRLSIVGYEFPYAVARLLGSAGSDFNHDANWLVVEGDATDGDRAWSFRDPCLLTADARELAAWLDAVADRRPDLDSLEFLEPNLAFSRSSSATDPPVVRVTFRLEARPPWMPDATEDDWDSAWLEFDMSPEALQRAASDLRTDLERFPER